MNLDKNASKVFSVIVLFAAILMITKNSCYWEEK